MLLTSYPTPQDYGALGNGVHDDTSAINATLAATFAAGGGIVFLPWGNYLISGPVSIPPYVTLQGQAAVSLPLIVSGAFPNVSRIVMSASWAPGSASGIVQLQSQTPGGWSAPASASGLVNVVVDGSLNSSTNANGVLFTGPVYDAHLENVFIYKPGHNGVASTTFTETGITPTSAYHLRFTRVTVDAAAFRGWGMVNPTDSTIIDCLMFGCTDNGWEISGTTGNTTFIGCRAEWNGGYGFHVTGAQTGMSFAGCSTDNNTKTGLFLDTVASSGDGVGVSWVGGKLHDDGKDGSSSGVSVSSCTLPISITGTAIGTGNTSASYLPVTGLTVTGTAGLTVAGCSIWGHTTSWSDGGGNTNLIRTGCLGVTGDPGSQTRALLPDITGGTLTASNVTVGATAALGDNGVGELALHNATTAPTTNPTGGGVAYATSGAAWYRDPNGVVSPMISPSEFSMSPTGCLGETLPRITVNSATQAIGATTGTVYMAGIWLPAGLKITNVSWVTGGTAAGTPTHWWLGIADSGGVQRGHTADQTTGAIAANTLVTKALASTYTTTATGLYYVLISVTATTNPTASGVATPTNMNVTSPLLAGVSPSAAQSTPGTDGTTTYTVPSTAGGVPYAYLT